jgi:outer membrane lipopolysaccharide assembly protein LptE/RlpB
MRLSRSILIVFLLAGLTACGFHLRGSISLPLPLISMQLIAEDLDSRQKTELERQLIRADASLEDNQAENAVRLRVSIRVLPDYKLADTTGSGKVIIRLLRELSYSLSTATGELLIDQKTILRHHDIDLDSNELAGFEYEKQSSGLLLDQELFEQLIFQLSHFQI